MAALLREPGGEAPLLGTVKDMKKALEMGITLQRGPIGKPGGGSLTKDFERQMKEVPGNGASLSVCAF